MRTTYLVLLLVICIVNYSYSQNVAINATGAAPNTSAMLDISSTNTGLLIPRLALSATNNAAPVTSPITSLMVYNTATAGAGSTAVTPGYYFWNGSIWVRVLDATAGDDWHIAGNSGTAVGTNFLGTTDNVSLAIRTNNTERIRVLNSGNVGIRTTTPSAELEINGWIGRTAHNNGALVGSYNNVGANSTYSNPIYVIGSNYKPNTTTLGNMYGIGYTHTNAGFISNAGSWGMYVAADGDARIWLAASASGDSYFNAGDLGVGTTAPSQKLDVNGNIRLRSHLYDSDNNMGTNGFVLSRDAGGVLWVNPDQDCADVADGFESGFGYWRNVGGDDDDWSMNSGSTSSSNTGPSGANEGTYYIYCETSGSVAGDQYFLESEMATCDNPSISFDYNMYFNVNTVGTFVLEVSTNGGSTWISLWSQTGNQGTAWINDQSVSLAAYANTNIVLRFRMTVGSTGSTYEYDCALDDIKLFDVDVNSFPNEDDWHTAGNSGTDPAFDFLGTIDNSDFAVRTNNTERLRVQNDGTVSIGTTLDNASNIYNRIEDATTNYSLYNYHNGTTTGTKYGLYNYISANGTGGRYGIYNNIYQNSASTSTTYGIYNNLRSYGSTAYNQYNYHYIYGASGTKYGQYNNIIIYSDPNTSTVYGEYTTIDYSSGTRYGEYKDLNTSATYTGTIYGDYNNIDGAGNDVAYGDYNNLILTGTGTHYGSYINVPGGTNDYAIYANAGNSVFNEIGGDYDVRMETDLNTHALWVDANENLVRFGSSSTTTDYQNGSTVSGTVVDYVVDFARGTSFDGTAIGIGSMEYLLDASARTLINNDFCPTTDAGYDLGYSSTTQYWDDVFADDFVNVSDSKAKEDIEDITYGLNEINQLRPVSYSMKNDPLNEKKLGLIAQEVLPVISEAVKTHDYKMADEISKEWKKIELDLLAMKYMYLIPVLIKAMQEEDDKIERLEDQLSKQQLIINNLSDKIILLEKQLKE